MIKKYTNIFSNDLIVKLKNYTRDGRQPSRTNFFSYPADIVGYSNALFGFDVSDYLKNEILSSLIAAGVLEKEPAVWNAFIHLMSRNSGIPWHDDASYVFSGTVYLNEIWDKNLGGYFVYEDGEEIKCIVPTYNTGYFYPLPLKHSCLLTAGNAPFRESVQIFIKEF